MIAIFRQVYAWLSRRRRTQFWLLLGLSFIAAFAELLSLGAFLPFLALLAAPNSVADYPLLGGLVASVGWSQGRALVIFATCVFGIAVAGAAAVRLVLSWASARYAQRVGHDVVMRLYSRLLLQPYAFFVSRNTSELLAGVYKVDSVVGSVIGPALDIIVACITAAAILVGLLFINVQVAVVAAVSLGGVYLVVSRLSRGQVIRNSRISSVNFSNRLQAMQEGLGGIRDVLLDGSQSFHVSRFAEKDYAARRALAQNSLWGSMPRFLVEALGIAFVAGLAVLASLQPGGISAALPTIGALALGAQKLLPLLQRIYGGWNQLTGSIGSLEDVAAIANIPVPSGAVLPSDASKLAFSRELVLRDVGFRYSEAGNWVFRGLHLTIPKGARVGIVGETGCGKSTILDLVMGLLVPTEGDIEVDGVRLSDANRRLWQAHIAHVPQSIFLTDASVAANIAFGVPVEAIDRARLERAARLAKIHDVILGLEDGYDTFVGERGVRLSGGQRQRIGIARALYRDADVLVLDEATSALDGGTESSVMQGIQEVGRNVTVLIVAHRISTLDDCDFILRMQRDGVSVERRK